jgi:hypothetical protein
MIAGYLAWHYSYAFRDGLSIFLDGLRFLCDFFSFRRLSATLFRPLGFNADAAGFLALVSRGMGALVRMFLMAAGVVAIVAWTLFCVAICIAWPFLPLLTLAGLAASIVGFIQHGL